MHLQKTYNVPFLGLIYTLFVIDVCVFTYLFRPNLSIRIRLSVHFCHQSGEKISSYFMRMVARFPNKMLTSVSPTGGGLVARRLWYNFGVFSPKNAFFVLGSPFGPWSP